MENNQIQHSNPVWADRSDYVIAATIQNSVYAQKYHSEQLSAKRIDEETYVITCIPFMLYDVMLGDTVKVDSEYYIKRVERYSDYYGYRIFCKKSVDEFLQYIQSAVPGVLYERGFGQLCAVAVEGKYAHILVGLLELDEHGYIAEWEAAATDKNFK